MLAYNLNCWLMLFNREGAESTETLRHTTLATARLRFLFLAAKIWRHGGQVGVRYSDYYQEQGIFQRLMERLRAVAGWRRRVRARCDRPPASLTCECPPAPINFYAPVAE